MQQGEPVQLLVRPEEAARMLNVGRSTLYELLASGEIKSVKIGRSRRVAVESLRQWVARLTSEQEAA